MGEGYLGQRWRIWDIPGLRNEFFFRQNIGMFERFFTNTYWILLNSLHSLYTTIIIITNTKIALRLMQLDLLPFEVLTESPNNLQMYYPNEFSPSSSFIFDGSITWVQSKCDPLEPLEEHPSIEHREALINWQNNQPNHHHLFLYQY